MGNSDASITRALVEETTSKDSFRDPKSFSAYKFVIRPAHYVTRRFTRPLPSRRARNLDFSNESDQQNSISNFDPYKYKLKTITKNKKKNPSGFIFRSPASLYKFKKSPYVFQHIKPPSQQKYLYLKQKGFLRKKYNSATKYPIPNKGGTQQIKRFSKQDYLNHGKMKQRRPQKFEEWMSERMKSFRRDVFERMEIGRNKTKNTSETNIIPVLLKNQSGKLKLRRNESKEQDQEKPHQEERDYKEKHNKEHVQEEVKEEQVRKEVDQEKHNYDENNQRKWYQEDRIQNEENQEGKNKVDDDREGKDQGYEQEEQEETNNFRINVFAPPRAEARSLDFSGKGRTLIRPASIVYRRSGQIVQSRKAKLLKILFDTPLSNESNTSKKLTKRNLNLSL